MRSSKYVLIHGKTKPLGDVCRCFVSAAQPHSMSTTAKTSKTVL